MPGSERSFAGGAFALELDGSACGFPRSIAGGNAVAEVIAEPPGPDGLVHKHIGSARFEPIALQVGLGMTKSIYDWIAAAWRGEYVRKDGAIIATDASRKERARRAFHDALITEVTVPALDAAAKNPAFLTLELAPERVESTKGSGSSVGAPTDPRQKQFVASNFRLAIDGLDCTRVAKIDAMTVRTVAAAGAVGDERRFAREPAAVEFPNLRVALAASSAATWRAWFADFVLKGNNGAEQERNGRIDLLSPDRQVALATITLHGLGIYRLDDDWTAGTDQAQRVHAGLYCERMELAVGKQAVARVPAGVPARPVAPVRPA